MRHWIPSTRLLAVTISVAGLALGQPRPQTGEERWAREAGLRGFQPLDPQAVTEPLDLTGMESVRLPLVSLRGMTWTGVRFSLYGVNAGDSYQPGRPLARLDAAPTGEFRVRSGVDPGDCGGYTGEVCLMPGEPASGWRFRIADGGTARALASRNLPEPAARGLLQRDEQFRWFNRSEAEAGGPAGRKADVLAAAAAQWGTQPVPQAASGQDLSTRILFGMVRGRWSVSRRDQVRGQWSGSRVRLSDWGLPAGVEALAARRMGPDYFKPRWGFPGLREADRFDAAGAGWTRAGPRGSFELSYARSMAVLDAAQTEGEGAASRIDLIRGVAGRIPPLAGTGRRTRDEVRGGLAGIEGAFRGLTHRISAGGGWERAAIRNLLTAPSNRNLITAGGSPAFVLELNTPNDSRQRIESWVLWLRDQVQITPRLRVEATIAGDGQRGRSGTKAVSGGRIGWASLSPRASVAYEVFSRLTIRAGYARSQAPLAGRMLDYGDAGSLSGKQFLWSDHNEDGQWQAAETGPMVMRFGGAYSEIGRELRRPRASEVNVGAEASLPWRLTGTLRMFHRRERDRLAAVNTGVSGADFSPREVHDPGADGIDGTPDDLSLTVYAQDPATLGQDRYLLTNPEGLEMLNKGIEAELRGAWRWVGLRAAFLAVKSRGETNPGNSVFENDSGVVGALMADPNTRVHAAGRSFFDRAYTGQAGFLLRLPERWSGLEAGSTVSYLDGLAFGRRMLVQGLPQGPFLAAATIRGSPEGGHRTQYVLNWNLRVSRPVRTGKFLLRPSVDVLNVLNGGNKIREMDITDSQFSKRPPLAIQPPRYLRIHMEVLF